MPLMHARAPRFTLTDYLEWELSHSEKFEYAGGLILAMAGAQPRHNEVAVNTTTALSVRLRGRCRVLNSDQRLCNGDGLHTYADAAVVCGAMQLTTYKGTGTLHNACLVVEVLSKSTREYDLGEKLESFQTTPSIQDILLIEPDTVDVRHVRRTEMGWETRRFRSDLDEIDLMGITLPLSEIYLDAPG